MISLPLSSLRGNFEFEELRQRGRLATEEGRTDEALELLTAAHDLAQRGDDPELLDLAFCNLSAVLILLGRQRETLAGLRQILLRNTCSENIFLAAYNLSRAHVRDKEFKKGLFYARVVRDRAYALDQSYWQVVSANQIANCLMDDSYFEEAAAEYHSALAMLPEEPSVARALPLGNLGYCMMMTGQLRAGMVRSLQALRWLRRESATIYEIWPRMDLCYGYLELGRLRQARRHGQRAMELAESQGDPDRIKNALYLLGEVARAEGDPQAAYEHFSHLQHRFYPTSPEIAHLMVAVGTRQMVNLRA